VLRVIKKAAVSVTTLVATLSLVGAAAAATLSVPAARAEAAESTDMSATVLAPTPSVVSSATPDVTATISATETLVMLPIMLPTLMPMRQLPASFITTPSVAPVVTAQPAKPKAAPAKHKHRRKVHHVRWRRAKVSWYGPGFYGHTMAGGGKLTRSSLVVAHRSLPFGTKVQIMYRGRKVIAVVKDRGPFVRGRTFDLGPGTAKRLGFNGVGYVKWRIIKRR